MAVLKDLFDMMNHLRSNDVNSCISASRHLMIGLGKNVSGILLSCGRGCDV
jgi:hypothetical protein